jgi:hypothetical protein
VTDLFLGVIAVSVLLMAVMQVAAVIWAARTARRVNDLAARMERHLQPVMQSLQATSAEAAKAAALAAVQMERADEMMAGLRDRVDETVRGVQDTLLRPAQDLLSLLQALRNVFARTPAGPGAYDRRRRQPDEEDALFIG